MRLASWRPTVVFPAPGKPTQAIRCGFEFNGLKNRLDLRMPVEGARKAVLTPQLKDEEHNRGPL